MQASMVMQAIILGALGCCQTNLNIRMGGSGALRHCTYTAPWAAPSQGVSTKAAHAPSFVPEIPTDLMSEYKTGPGRDHVLRI